MNNPIVSEVEVDVMLPEKLYMVRILKYGVVPDFALEAFAERFPDAHAEGRFFYPSVDRVYRSLSGAQARADLLRFNGVWCEVVETTTGWRKHETRKEYVARLERENAQLRARIDALA